MQTGRPQANSVLQGVLFGHQNAFRVTFLSHFHSPNLSPCFTCSSLSLFGLPAQPFSQSSLPAPEIKLILWFFFFFCPYMQHEELCCVGIKPFTSSVEAQYFLFCFFNYENMITHTGGLENTEQGYIQIHYILKLILESFLLKCQLKILIYLLKN